MRLRSLASLRPWLYPYNIEIIYIPISIIYYLVSYYGTVFLCINLLLTFTVIQPTAAKVINKQINQKPPHHGCVDIIGIGLKYPSTMDLDEGNENMFSGKKLPDLKGPHCSCQNISIKQANTGCQKGR